MKWIFFPEKKSNFRTRVSNNSMVICICADCTSATSNLL